MIILIEIYGEQNLNWAAFIPGMAIVGLEFGNIGIYYGKHLDELRKSLKERRYRTLEILKKYFSDLATWQAPAGGYYIWLRLNAPIQMKHLFDRCFNENVLINPGSLYYPGSNNHIRISYSYATLTEIEEGLYRLSSIIKKS